MTRSQMAALVLILAAGAAPACAKKVAPAAPSAVAPAAAAMQAPAAQPVVATVAEQAPVARSTPVDLFGRKTLAELNAEAPLRSVYFALDKSVISDEGQAVLHQNAQWLAQRPSTRFAIEGHCDDTGSTEYNLALGDRRAAAVKDYLVALGVAAERMVVVSKGKEVPVCLEKDESCRWQNRRGYFVFTAK